MRTWRVGSVSMGLSLVLLGIFLFVSQMTGTQLVEPLLLWWPLILVVLGIEIIVYSFLSKKEDPIVKYDFLSILFVGILGTIGIVFTLLSSIGLLSEVQDFMGAEYKSFDLPVVEENLPGTITRIVLETNGQKVNVEGSDEEKLHVFGTYRATISSHEKPPLKEKGDYIMTKKVGDTLYITIKEPTVSLSPFSNSTTTIEPTIVVPNSIRVDARDEHNSGFISTNLVD